MTNDFDLKGKAREMSAPQDSNIVFSVGNNESKEMIKLCGNGDIFVKGKLIERDEELVQGMKDFLTQNNKSKENAELTQAVKDLAETLLSIQHSTQNPVAIVFIGNTLTKHSELIKRIKGE